MREIVLFKEDIKKLLNRLLPMLTTKSEIWSVNQQLRLPRQLDTITPEQS